MALFMVSSGINVRIAGRHIEMGACGQDTQMGSGPEYKMVPGRHWHHVDRKDGGVSKPLITKWIRKFSKIPRQKLNAATIPEHAKDIQILELDGLFSYCKKT